MAGPRPALATAPIHPLQVRQINESDLNWALAEGWRDFQVKRGELVLLALIYPVVGLIAAVAALDQPLLPMFFPLVAGLSLLGPAAASGFYELARRREAGLNSSWVHFVDPLRGRSRVSLAVLTAGLAALTVAWLAVASLIYKATIGSDQWSGASDFFARLFTTPQGWTMIIVGNLAGLAFAIVSLTLSFVSFPLVVDKPVDAVTAVATSIRAVAKNPRVAASWGLRVAALLLLGCLPLFVGLAVVLPVLGYASWHLYTRVVER
jgi:uncharacterized membrane protein